MKTIQVFLICLLAKVCVGLANGKGNPAWTGNPFKTRPNYYFPSTSDDFANYYYEAYDLGGNRDFETFQESNKKPDVRPPFAFKSNVSSSIHEFAFDLFSSLTQNKSSTNLIISPLSIYTALSMLTLGLGGNSKTQALAVLRGQNISDIHASMDELSKALFDENRKNVTLTKANRIFVDRSIKLYKTFRRRMKKDYHASAKKVNFIRQPETNRRRINGFVQRHTKHRIKNLAPVGSITSDTRLFIANAMYLKAFWATSFSNATQGQFHISSSEFVPTQIMTSIGRCSYNLDDDLQATVVRNPLKGELSMIMIVPNTAGDFKKLEDSKGKERVRQALEKLYENGDDWLSICQLSMPKFKIDYTADAIVKGLRKMGLTDVFNPNKADLSQMTPAHNRLYVSDFRHKSSIDVNESGVEGAAATSAVYSLRMMPTPVAVDRPFTFIIRDDVMGATLFVGKVVRPQYN